MIKKLFLTILLTLVLSGGANSTTHVSCGSSERQNSLMANKTLILGMSYRDFGKKICNTKWSDYNDIYSSSYNFLITIQDKNVYLFKKETNQKWLKFGFLSDDGKLIGIFNSINLGTNFNQALEKIKSEEGSVNLNHKYNNQAQINSLLSMFRNEKEQIIKEKEQKQEAIMFTIKDKREQCEAIGFKQETEKFADCVLRLVELDVKQQTQNQIAVAQNNGNDALVKQLKRQSDLQSSQALIDLGQQLMNPKRYNSNIYMPQTQRCTIQGFGTFATMRCR